MRSLPGCRIDADERIKVRVNVEIFLATHGSRTHAEKPEVFLCAFFDLCAARRLWFSVCLKVWSRLDFDEGCRQALCSTSFLFCASASIHCAKGFTKEVARSRERNLHPSPKSSLWLKLLFDFLNLRCGVELREQRERLLQLFLRRLGRALLFKHTAIFETRFRLA